MAKEVGLMTIASVVFGFPGETRETAMETIKLIEEINPDDVGYYIATPYPGTPMADYVKKMGWIRVTDFNKYDTATPIDTAVGMLDSEITTADQSEKNLILVGGPCANTLVRTLLDSTEATCVSDFEDMGYTAGTAMIKYVADAWGTGKAALIVAGNTAADTRAACAVLQDYDANTDTLVGEEAIVA